MPTRWRVRRPDDLCQHHADHAGSGKSPARLCRGRQGFIPLHCASYCFLNSPKYIALVGAQFLRHGTGIVRTTIAEPEHPIMHGFNGFESWDETYVHTKHNDQDRVVLEYREEGGARNPGLGCARRARAESSTPPGATIDAPGATRAFRPWSSAAFAGPPAATRPRRPRRDRAVRRSLSHARNDAAARRTSSRSSMSTSARRFPTTRAAGPGACKGEPCNMMQKPLAPDESLKHMVVPKGFHVQLFASEADFAAASRSS